MFRTIVTVSAVVLAVQACKMPDMRPAQSERKFVSSVIDDFIASAVPKFKDSNLATLFANTLPNTLDTTVEHFSTQPLDTFVITGDIDAMWLRDSTNQVLPLLPFINADTKLRSLIAGVISRHASSVLIDAYANAFNYNEMGSGGPHQDDMTSKPSYAGTRQNAMTSSVFERKYELDSLANVLYLSSEYYSVTKDTTPFNTKWLQAVDTILDTMTTQQLDTAEEGTNPVYQFQRVTGEPTDTLEHARGFPCKHTGLIKSAFRPSDDATKLPFNIPANAYAVVALRGVANVLNALQASSRAQRALALADVVDKAIQTHGIVQHPVLGKVYAYEVDGFGNSYFMDDANVPSLLSLPYLGYTNASDAVYIRTRTGVLSTLNPYYFNSSIAEGIGGPHNGYGYIWPMSIIMRALTATSDAEIEHCLNLLIESSACSGLMHESFWLDDFDSYTRSWFAWANSLFGHLVYKIAQERPYIIFGS